MVSIHWGYFLGSLCFLPTEGIFVIFGYIFQIFLCISSLLGTQWGYLIIIIIILLNYTQFSYQVCSRLFIFFSNVYQPFLFLFILFISPISSHSLTLSTKAFYLSHILSQSDPHLLLQSQFLSQTLSSPSMAPKSKKCSYIISTDSFHLTRWNGAVRLTKAPPLTYRSQQHLSEGVRAGSVSFSKFSHFSSFL